MMRVDGRAIEISRPDKKLFPDGATKGDLIKYYSRIAETILPHLKERPLTMHRFPGGVGEESFYQKEIPRYFPSWIERVTVKKEGGEVTQVVCNDAATLAYLANQACIELHIWLSKRSKLAYPDRLIFDLDPPAGKFYDVCKGALMLKEILSKVGLSPFVMTTGSKGLHVVVPLFPELVFDGVREFAHKVAAIITTAEPERYTTEQRKEKRAGRVFIDTGRNAYAQMSIAAYSVRARERPSIATPLDWSELQPKKLTPNFYNLHNIFRRLAQKDDPWREIDKQAGSLPLARERL